MPTNTIPADPGFDADVVAVRRFSRFYTRAIGLIGEGLYGSRHTLAEVRVLYEIATRPNPVASAIGADLGLDPGYLSRILARFEADGLIKRRPAADDARRSEIHPTEAGRLAFVAVDATSRREIAALLAPLSEEARGRLTSAMAAIEALLAGPGPAPSDTITLRPHRPGDMGWVTSRHGALYAAEFGYDMTFEALVAEITAKFVRDFDPAHEMCRIAERDGARLGSVFVVKASDEVAKLRLLIVEPSARGLGLGRRLVEAALAFARVSGYRRMVLWTQDHLTAARAIYESAGFTVKEREPHTSFGKELVAEVWEKEL